MNISGVVPPDDGLGSPPGQGRKRGMGRTACSRCKTRKQRCDGKLPICSSCIKAGATCDLQNIRGEDVVVAKYIQTLEIKIAELEIQLRRFQRSGPEQPGDTGFPLAGHMGIGDVVNSLCFDLPEASSFSESSQFGLHLALNLGDPARNSPPRSTGDLLHQDSPASSGNHSTSSAIANCAGGAGPPSEELGTKLIQTYFERLDWRYPFLDLDEILSLHEERERLSQIDHQSLTKCQQFGLFKLYIVYAVGSGLLLLTEKDISSPMPEAFYVTAMQHISAAREPRSLENIEAMVLLVIFHLRCSINQELWYLIGFAMRTCIHLGMYLSRREVDHPPSSIQKRRKLFWTVYSLERNISIALGYPASLPDRLIDVELPTLMHEDDHGLRQAILMFQLRRIESRIHHSIYRNDRALQELLPKTEWHYQQLQEWKNSLVISLGVDNSRRLDYFLLHYYRAIRLLIQPFLSILPGTDPYYKACVGAAGQICQLHKRLHQNSDYGHSFIAVQTVFVSGIMLLYCLWTHPDDVWSIRLSNNIRACSSVLFVMGERTSWVRRYRDAFEALVTVTMERLEAQQDREPMAATEDISLGPNAIQPLQDTQMGNNPITGSQEFTMMSGPVDPMPPPLQALQDRWMEFDSMAVLNELVTWADPDMSATQAPCVMGYGNFGDSSWEEWQLP
ncbi:fungal-specific transcription factor domain-containing protein [Aspergillus ambiguus]|uniref:Zn(II)2Cys6 transcription factor n=1 Tax=Aspergillus ambiguus TaxID=176160 RepID=UPI003CCE2304